MILSRDEWDDLVSFAEEHGLDPDDDNTVDMWWRVVEANREDTRLSRAGVA